MNEFLVIEASYNLEEEVNTNNELTTDCKILIGRTLYDFLCGTNTLTKIKELTELDMEQLTSKDRFLGSFNTLEDFKASKLLINGYVIIENILYIFDSSSSYLLKQKKYAFFDDDIEIEDAISKSTDEKVEYFIIKNVLYHYDKLNKALTIFKTINNREEYSNEKYVVLTSKTWEYIIQHLTRNSTDNSDLKTFRNENELIDNSSYSAEKILSSEYIAAYIAGMPKENFVLHNVQEVQRLLNIRTTDLPMTAKNGGIIINKNEAEDSPKQKVFSSQILNQKLKNNVLAESEEYNSISSDNSFLTSLELVEKKLGDNEDLKQYNDNMKINIIDMINQRFNHIGNLKKLETKTNTSCVDALNEINDSIIKTGTIIWYAGLKVPDGWKMCDGSIVLVADYPELYAAIGNKYVLSTDLLEEGVQFRLPTGTARTIVGYDESNPNFNELGKRDGINDIALDQNFLIGKQHFIHGLSQVRKNEMEEPDKDKVFDQIYNWCYSWLPADNEKFKYWNTANEQYYTYNGYNRFRFYNNASTIANILVSGNAYQQIFNWSGTTRKNTLSENFKETHNNIQPYNTLQMIIKVDKIDLA